MQNNSKILKFMSAVVAIAILAVVLIFVNNLIFGDKNKVTEPGKSQISKEDNITGSSYSKAIAISIDDTKNMTGAEFAKKYDNKWVSFNGIIVSTNQHSKDLTPFTTLVLGESENDISFSDMSILKVPATKSTFDVELTKFADINNTPADTNTYPKANVTVKVVRFDAESGIIYLNPNANVDGNSPSVRHI